MARSTWTDRYTIAHQYLLGADAVRVDLDFSEYKDGERVGPRHQHIVQIRPQDFVRIGKALDGKRSPNERGHALWHLAHPDVPVPCSSCPERLGGESPDDPEEKEEKDGRS